MLSDQLQEKVPSLQEALAVANEADRLEGQQSYRKALELYKQAVEKILPVIEGELSTDLIYVLVPSTAFAVHVD